MANEFEGLFVKFGANTVEFDNSVKGMNTALTGLKKEFQTINKQLKFDPDNVDLLNKKMENLQEQAKVGALKVEELRKKQADLGKEKVGTEEWNKLELEIGKVEMQMQVVGRASEATAKRLKDVGDPQSVHNLDKALDEVAQDLDTVNKKLQLNPNDVEAAAEKMELLGKQASLADQKVEALKKEQQGLGSENIGTTEWKELERQIVEAQLEAQEFKGAIDGVGEASTSLDDIGKKLDAGNFMDAAEAIAEIGEGIKDFGGNALDSFREVDDAMDTITGKTGLASDEFSGLYENISSTIAVESLTDIGSALGELNTQFGLTGKELEDASTYMLKFAQINETDVTQSTINAKQAMELFGLSSDKLPSVLDAVTGTAQRTGQSVDGLFAQVEKGAPALKRLGLDFDTSVEVLGQFSKAGLDGDKTIASLTKATTVYAKQGKTLNDGLAETSEKIRNATTDHEGLAIATEIFGKNAPAMNDAIRNGTLNLNEMGKAAKENGGLVGETFEKQVDPIDQMTVAQQQLTNTMAKLGAEIAETLAPMLESLGKVLKKVSEIFGSLPNPVKQFIIVFGGLLATIGLMMPIIAGLKAISGAFKVLQGITKIGTVIQAAFNAVMTANPIGIIIVAIAALVAALVYFFTQTKLGKEIWSNFMEWLKKAWEGIATFFSDLWTGIKETAVNIWNGLGQFFSGLWTGIKETIAAAWNGIKEFFSSNVGQIVTLIISPFFGLANMLYQNWDKIKAAASAAWEWIKSTVTNIVTGVVNTVKGIWDGLKNYLSGVWNGIKNTASNIWNGIKSTVITIVSGMINGATNWFNNLRNNIDNAMSNVKNSVSNAWNNIKNFFSNGVNSILNTVSGIGQKIADKFNGIVGKILGVIGDLGSIGQKIIDGILSGLGNLGGKIADKISSAVTDAKAAVGNIIGGIFGKDFNGSFNVNGSEYGGAIGSMFKLKADGLMPDVQASTSSSTLNIHVEATGNDANSIARAVERAIVRRMTR